MSHRILVPLPHLGADPSEVAIPWRVLTEAGMELVFATPSGRAAEADRRMLTGEGLGLWKSVLMARKDAVSAYLEMAQCVAFRSPLPYPVLDANDFHGLLLPGGHDKTVKEYLESELLQKLVAAFFAAQKPVAAICHGVVLAARSKYPATGKSVLHSYQTTALLERQEMLAYRLTRRRLGDYYLTYPGLTVEAEVSAALAAPQQFQQGPTPLFRDDAAHLGRGFVVVDRNYVSARWPGDVYNFSLAFRDLVQKS
ncbi:MAG: DJ-1/PfpI family protein [Saprospiraceae bacterium]|nr:DJ-1/PfpI family protein [Saprospiraceae bacterium]